MEVVFGCVDQVLGELEAVFVDLFGRERRDHLAHGAFERLLSHLLDLTERAPQEALDGVADEGVVRVDLHRGDGVDVQRDVARRVGVLDADVHRQEAHVHAVHAVGGMRMPRAPCFTMAYGSVSPLGPRDFLPLKTRASLGREMSRNWRSKNTSISSRKATKSPAMPALMSNSMASTAALGS